MSVEAHNIKSPANCECASCAADLHVPTEEQKRAPAEALKDALTRACYSKRLPWLWYETERPIGESVSAVARLPPPHPRALRAAWPHMNGSNFENCHCHCY